MEDFLFFCSFLFQISILYLRQQKFMHDLMLCLTCSPLGAKNPIFANLKILARFYQILSYVFTLKVTSPPILIIKFSLKIFCLFIFQILRDLFILFFLNSIIYFT